MGKERIVTRLLNNPVGMARLRFFGRIVRDSPSSHPGQSSISGKVGHASERNQKAFGPTVLSVPK